ncbi:PB1-F2 protein [Influenza A virus (A/duck/Vietnam/LBM806/2015(H5N6))]|nr:PB1-F2 protein [Influenza A virus (A/duck/Vietnam/LBM751/2014(H5N6))]BAQ35934.1 PB1-F2 protein [Influenza A virus (A/duck/Vietnam/LBM752/2014(H5N6))]BAQ35945.1 PB1-F2 protein [Influenza A virus (A/muscovy duck/Vietnam/LBM754/2014(H5N6))]BAQ35956.1 PB1-F2 protein [Influenza A virus (A/muscovy duck/Vietnam/LBM755/2014(H5N6))]BAQ35967.1 PB1-F2 protein [Influenza A virus (A/muscovy duck/Vietnam/LBM756/2014(H5N6))]BAQ35978.1 PB1-F2 protein [Influenza A virus (A/muscovy duck/Vietnam/LBM757/2014(H
MEQGQGTPWTQ